MTQKEKPTIMIVDDSQTIQRTATLFLSQDYDVKVFSDGYEALAAVNLVKPDLLFLDVMMPRLNGYDACMMIKQNNEFRHLPVIMLSSKDSPFDRAKGVMMGCDDYLTKPFTKEKLVASIDKHLKKST